VEDTPEICFQYRSPEICVRVGGVSFCQHV